jgi:predicted regulator of Ras-like GTPase activity (Roadblock/LC7/MglB family)
MNNEVYTFALQNTLNEIKNVCPTVSNTFIFKEGKILANDKDTDRETAASAAQAFDAITERADALGGLETVTIQGANGRVNIACINDFYLTTVASKEADEKYVNTLTRVLVPIVLRLVEKINPDSINDETLTTIDPEPADDNYTGKTIIDTENYEKEQPKEEIATFEPEPIQEPEPEVNAEPYLPEPPVTQFIVENLGGLLVPSDTVRIDNAVIAQWKELYGDKKIEEADLETLNGKTGRFKFKSIKDSKHEGKGIIQMPEKIQLTLETAKGELVMVKPVIE